jgi:nucleoside-diphosphate-sugar epimerase
VKVFLAGGSGAIGRVLIPELLRAGHEVVALARTPAKASALEAMGTTTAVADALDREALHSAIVHAKPEAVIHQLTALSQPIDFKKLDQSLALTNRLRTEALDTMLRAARGAGAKTFIAQSFCGWTYARVGGPVKSENDPLDPHPPRAFEKTLEAIRYLENTVKLAGELRAIALRYGFFYGPGTSIASDGDIAAAVRKRRLPIVGGGGGIWSFIHVADAARFTVAALTRGSPGIFNVVDDEPSAVSDWLPYLARVLGAEPPRRVPAWLARFAIGSGGVGIMTKNRGASNAKAKRELGAELRYPSWRVGFAEGLG